MLKSGYLHPESPNITDMFRSKDSELVVSGPYESGKTFPIMSRLHLLHMNQPMWSLVVRKTKASLVDSVLPEFENKILPVHPMEAGSLCKPYGGRTPRWYDYWNGGRMVIGGMDEPKKVLSSAYDLIYYNQCEEATLDEWETLLTRCTGRSGRWRGKDGQIRHQLIGDCNPDSPFHWIKRREEDGRLRLIVTTHKDNMTLYRGGQWLKAADGNWVETGKGTWTENGVETRSTLINSLTGMRYKRGYLGEWVAAEGQVYDEFTKEDHIIDRLPDMTGWVRYRSIDFGLIHPFVCTWWAQNPDNGTLINYREWRKTNWMVADHAKKIKDLSEDELISMTVSDHDAEDNLTLHKNGITTELANKSVLPGVEAVKRRLRDKKLLFYADALVEPDFDLKLRQKPMSVIEEFPSYIHKPIETHIGVSDKDDLPVKDGDDGLDTTRYIVMALDASIDVGFGSRVASLQTRL